MRHRAGPTWPAILAVVLLAAGGLLPGSIRLSLPPAATIPLPTAEPTAFGAPSLPPATITTTVLPGELLVRFRPALGNGPAAFVQAQSALVAAGVTGVVERPLLAPNSFVVGVSAGQEMTAATRLMGQPAVQAAAPNLVRQIHAGLSVTPNDPLYPAQWGDPRVNAPAAWGSAQSNPVLVAVLDTGIDLNHPEFAGRIAPGANFVTPGGSVQDDNGHGTHVSGIIAAAGNNGIGGAGLAWNATILPIKVADGSGNLSSEAWINGLAYAVQRHAQVVNMSFGGTTYSAVEQAAIADAWNAGLLLVASAGNSGNQGNPVEYPAAYPNVLSVGAIGSDNMVAYYSETNGYVALTAPGGNAHYANDPDDHFIFSTWPLNLAGNVQPGYAREVGTSQAAAFVSGVAALMVSTGPGWTNRGMAQRLEASATDLGPSGRDDSYGYGLINAAAAVANPPGGPPPPSPTPPAPPPTVPPTPRPTAPPTVPPTPPPGATPIIPPGCLFVDTCPGRDWFAPFVADLCRRGALAGYADATFRPDLPISRGQMAKLAVLIGGAALVTIGGPHFADVPPTNPFYPYIETAYTQGIIGGYADGNFHPFDAVNRGQMAKMVVVARGWPLADPGTPTFRDVPYGSAYYFYVETAVALQVMAAYDDDTFRPFLKTSRASAAQIVDLAAATYRPGFGR